jgi:hypothetical protein
VGPVPAWNAKAICWAIRGHPSWDYAASFRRPHEGVLRWVVPGLA